MFALPENDQALTKSSFLSAGSDQEGESLHLHRTAVVSFFVRFSFPSVVSFTPRSPLHQFAESYRSHALLVSWFTHNGGHFKRTNFSPALSPYPLRVLDSMCMTDTTSQLESTAPELLPLWVRHGHQVPEELVRDLNLGGVRPSGRYANYPSASRIMRCMEYRRACSCRATRWCLRHSGTCGGEPFGSGWCPLGRTRWRFMTPIVPSPV